MIEGILPSDPYSRVGMLGIAAKKLLGGAGPGSLFKSPLLWAVMDASPKRAVRGYGATKDYLLGRGARPMSFTGELAPEQPSAIGYPQVFSRPVRGPRGAGIQGMKSFMMDKFSQDVRTAPPDSPEKTAGVLHSIATGLRRARDWVYPEIRSAVDIAPGKRSLRPALKMPLTLAGIGTATYGLMSGVDYLAGQADLIHRARAYRSMMKKYGPELRSVADEQERGEGYAVPHEKIRDLFNAVYAVAPDVAKEPTLASGQVAALIRDVGNPTETGEAPNFLMQHGIQGMKPTSDLQRGKPQRRLPSDYVTSGVGQAIKAMADYDPYAIAGRQAKDGAPWVTNKIKKSRDRLTRLRYNMAQLVHTPHDEAQYSALKQKIENAEEELANLLVQGSNPRPRIMR